jgi:hypothetical protein
MKTTIDLLAIKDAGTKARLFGLFFQVNEGQFKETSLKEMSSSAQKYFSYVEDEVVVGYVTEDKDIEVVRHGGDHYIRVYDQEICNATGEYSTWMYKMQGVSVKPELEMEDEIAKMIVG